MGHVRCGECVLSIKLGCHRQLCHIRVPLGHVSRGGLVPSPPRPLKDLEREREERLSLPESEERKESAIPLGCEAV